MKYYIILKICNSIRVLMDFVSKNPNARTDLLNTIQDIRNYIADLRIFIVKDDMKKG